MLKKFITAGALAAFGLAGAAAQADEKLVWDYSWFGNPRAVTKGTEAVAAFLAEKTGGNWELKIHYGEAVSPSKQNIDNIKRGAIHAATVCTGYHPGKNPIGTVGDLPFLPFKTWGKLIAGHEAIRTNEHWIAEMKKWGGKPWYSNILPQYEFFGVGDPPKNAMDWNGKTVRALGGIGEAMVKLGAALKSAPAPDCCSWAGARFLETVRSAISLMKGSRAWTRVSTRPLARRRPRPRRPAPITLGPAGPWPVQSGAFRRSVN